MCVCAFFEESDPPQKKKKSVRCPHGVLSHPKRKGKTGTTSKYHLSRPFLKQETNKKKRHRHDPTLALLRSKRGPGQKMPSARPCGAIAPDSRTKCPPHPVLGVSPRCSSLVFSCAAWRCEPQPESRRPGPSGSARLQNLKNRVFLDPRMRV